MAKSRKQGQGLACPQVKHFKLAELTPVEDNPRTISDEALAGLSKSVERFGCVELIVVNTRGGKNRIVGGNQRFRVLQEAGVTECIAVTVDISPNEERLLNVTLNNPHIQGEFSEMLPNFIDDLRGALPDVDLADLRIDDLVLPLETEPLRAQRETLVPFKRTHVLLSFPPSLMGDISELLESIQKHPEVEYEQGSN